MIRNTNISVAVLAGVIVSVLSPLAFGGSSCWLLDEGAGATAFDSVGGRHAAIRGDPVWVTGSFGRALRLDGEGDYLEVGQIYGLSAEQTKMLWIYINSFWPDGVYLIDEGGEGNNNWLELFDSSGDGNPQLRTGFDSFNYIDSKAGIRPGYWHHVAVVTRASGDLAIYINGVLDSSASGLSANNKPQAIVIGTDAATRTACFSGLIDDVAIYGRALSSGQVRRAYQDSTARYRQALDVTRIVGRSIQEIIAEKQATMTNLDAIMKKTEATAEALAGVLASDYNPASNEGSEMITAKQKMRAAMMHLEQSKKSLAMSIEQLEGVLRQLGSQSTTPDPQSRTRAAASSAEPPSDEDNSSWVPPDELRE